MLERASGVVVVWQGVTKRSGTGRESANAVVGKMSERGYDLLVQIQLALVLEEPKPLSLPLKQLRLRPSPRSEHAQKGRPSLEFKETSSLGESRSPPTPLPNESRLPIQRGCFSPFDWWSCLVGKRARQLRSHRACPLNSREVDPTKPRPRAKERVDRVSRGAECARANKLRRVFERYCPRCYQKPLIHWPSVWYRLSVGSSRT